ncbi:MAG: acyclic terpene utilization AtuA family protein [Syntrophaceae bacterium]
MSTTDTGRGDKVIIANCSGFFGDRLSAAKEMVAGGAIDFLTGDYLAELTMAILFRAKMKDKNGGYVPTFLRQMEQVMGECLDRNIRVVSNAGGLNPRGLATELGRLAGQLGLHPKIAYIEGDDLMGRLDELQAAGEELVHMDKGIALKDSKAMTISANAYLGCWGIVKALEEGAEIVVAGRVADASLVVGPAAWWHGWKQDDWDCLAGATTAGHIIECGAQATGGNYSFIDEVTSFRKVGFPLAEVSGDGSFVITKHPGTGGLVSVDTVKAQLLYEITGPCYLTPDLVARFDTIRISQQGPDRVLVTGVKGEPPTPTAKVCINTLGGYRNSMTVILTGLDIDKKARILEEALFDAIGGREQFQHCDVQLIRSDKEDPATNEEAFAYLRITVMDPDQKKVDRVSSKIVELALANIPGFAGTAPPAKGTPAIVYWPALVSGRHLHQKVVVEGDEFTVESVRPVEGFPAPEPVSIEMPGVPGGRTVRVPLGRVFATRSGDKGGNANLGVWARTPEAFAFLREFLTIERLKQLLKDLGGYRIERCELPNLLAVNFYIRGILGEGAAASVRLDAQAKTLGEYLRARVVEMPESLVPGSGLDI